MPRGTALSSCTSGEYVLFRGVSRLHVERGSVAQCIAPPHVHSLTSVNLYATCNAREVRDACDSMRRHAGFVLPTCIAARAKYCSEKAGRRGARNSADNVLNVSFVLFRRRGTLVYATSAIDDNGPPLDLPSWPVRPAFTRGGGARCRAGNVLGAQCRQPHYPADGCATLV